MRLSFDVHHEKTEHERQTQLLHTSMYKTLYHLYMKGLSFMISPRHPLQHSTRPEERAQWLRHLKQPSLLLRSLSLCLATQRKQQQQEGRFSRKATSVFFEVLSVLHFPYGAVQVLATVSLDLNTNT